RRPAHRPDRPTCWPGSPCARTAWPRRATAPIAGYAVRVPSTPGRRTGRPPCLVSRCASWLRPVRRFDRLDGGLYPRLTRDQRRATVPANTEFSMSSSPIMLFKARGREFKKIAGPPGTLEVARLAGAEIANDLGAGVAVFEDISIPWKLLYNEVFYVL